MKLKYIYITIALLVVSFGMYGQSIFTNPITGTNPNTSNPYTSGQTINANITVTGIGRGSGIGGNNANDRYNANSWNTVAFDDTAYFEFTLTPNGGYEIDFVSFVYTSQTNNASIANFAFRSSVDSYASNIGSPDFDGTTISLSAVAYQNITTAVTFRLYAWGADTSGRTFSINDFTFNGAVVSTLDTTPPAVSILSPADGATGVTTTSNLVLTFNETVVVGTAGNIIIYNSNNSVFESIPYNDSRIVFNGTTGVTINPTGTFVNSASYYVQIDNTAIRDVALNNYAGIGNATDWNFTTVAPDVTPPTVTTLSPTDGATSVTTTSNLVLTFNENVVVGTAGNIVIYNSNNSLFETIPYNDTRIVFNGTTGVTINPTGTFVNSASYYVQIDNTAIRDVAQNNYAGISNTTDWNFTTIAASNCNELFISEYGEGTSDNKYIEIYNPTASSINLATGSYDIVLYVNGSATPSTLIALTGTIAANSTFVLKHTSANASITSNQTSGSLTFNGDDAVALRKATVLIDVIGQIGTDPGTEWGSGFNSTADNTIVRKSTVRTGDINGSDIFDPATEWDGFAVDTWTNIGTHESDCDTTPKITVSTTTLTGFSYATGSGPSAEQSFTVSGKNLLANLIVRPPSNYEISSTSGSGFVSNPSTLSFAPSSGIVTEKTIYVRLKSGLGVGTYSQDITATSTSATTKIITCSGVVLPPFYRSKQSGAWNTASNWESSADNSIFTTATVVPSNAVTAITILNNHNISIASGIVTADDLTVATGGTLTISGGTFILNNGLATNDLQVNGILTYSSGTFTQGSSGIVFGSGSTYNHALASSAIPTATWDSASTCIVTGMAGTGTGPTNVGQNYGNFTWNCTSQTAFFNINSSDFAVRGLFRVLSTGTQNLSMAGTAIEIYTNTINAASIEGGIFAIAFTSGVISTTTITNDLSISGGEVRISGASGTGTLNITGNLLMSGTGFLNPLSLTTSTSTTITVGGNVTMSGNSIIDFENVDRASISTVINVAGNFNSTSAGDTTNSIVIDFGGSTATGDVAGNTLNIAGNFSHTGTGQLQTTSNNAPTGIVFNGAGTKTFTYTTAGALDWVPITINSGTTLQLQNSFSIGASADAPVTNITVNGTLDFQNFAITAVTSTVPRFNTSAGSTLITANTAGLGGTGATGSLRGFNNVAATTPANGRLVFLAGTNYTFNGATTTPFPNGTIGNAATITVNAAITSNMTTNLTVTSAFNVNNGGTFTLNPTNNNNLLLNNAVLNINTGGAFDNGGENYVRNNSGSSSLNISGTFITRDVQGFVGSTSTAIYTDSPSSILLPTLNSGSTIVYGLAGNQVVQGLQAPTYQNIAFSGGGTKTLASTNSVVGTISVIGATTFDAGNSAFGSTTSNVTMTGASVYKLSGTTASKPESGGIYTLDPLSTFEFTGTSNTEIRVSSPTINYANIVISGTARNPATVTGIKFQSGRAFTVKSGGVFRLNNTAGFTGSTTTAIDNTNPPIITLETGSRVEFAGNQTLPATQTITPFSGYSDVGISGTGTKTLANTTEVYVGRDLLLFPETTPANTGFLQIDANRLLTVERNILNTSTKDLIIKNSGNLVQVTNVDNDTTNANTGNIKMTRTSRVMYDNDYIYWGSPVKENVLSQIPTNFDSTYQWDLNGGIDGAWNPLTAQLVPGRGFITKVASGVITATNFDFTGTPNNGTVTVTANAYSDPNADVSGNSILLSNPYPCAIDAEEFIMANGLLDGNLYFWTAATAVTNNAYSVGDYASWNSAGGTGTKATNDVSGNDNLKPSGKIAAGQGFFADIHADGIISFTNGMRERTTSGNSQFFKTTKQNKGNEKKSRVWLNLSNNKKAFRQMLVAYLSNATNGFDRAYDAESFTGNEIDIYSILENKNLVIQGRALPLDDTDIVPIGIAITNAGEYNIAIDEVDGLMDNKTIYLEDKLLNKTHNLSEGAHTFTTASGTFNNRFVLRYTNATLGTKDPKLVENQVLVFTKDKKIKVNSAIEHIDTITVYDLLGRQLLKKHKVNSKEFILSNLVAKQQLLLVKVALENGEALTKKVMF